MNVRYALSWEEFLEVRKGSEPGAAVGSFICMLLIGIVTGAFGLILLSFIDPPEPRVASVFCWLALAVFAAAFWDLKYRTRGRRQCFMRELRLTYDRYYSGEQEFAFDDETWTHGKYRAAWSRLTVGIERANTIQLATQDHGLVVPKRVIRAADGSETDALARLRNLALGAWGNGVEFRLSLADYLLVEVPSLWRRRPFLMTGAHFAGAASAAMIAGLTDNPAGSGVVVRWVLAGLLLSLTVGTPFAYFVTKYFTSGLRSTWESAFSDAGVQSRNSDVTVFLAWTFYIGFREARRAFLFDSRSSGYHIHPKRDLSPDEKVRLRSLLRSRMVTHA